MKNVEKATKARAKKEEMPSGGVCITLSVEQSNRLRGISHLEGGRDPLLILDALIDRDSKFRQYGLSLTKCEQIGSVIDTAVKQKWAPEQFVDFLVKLRSLGFNGLSEEQQTALVNFIENFSFLEWGSVTNFLNYVKEHHRTFAWFRSYLQGHTSVEKLREVMGV